MWVPEYIDVNGNEMADQQTKKKKNFELTKIHESTTKI